MNVRASDTDRDATVDLLREAAGEGRLTLEELTDRIQAAVSAVTRSDLVLLTGDLSTGATVGVATQPAEVRGWGDVKRSGPWTVPTENSFRLVGGGAAMGPAVLGALPAAASVGITHRVLRDDESLADDDRQARRDGRIASIAGAGAGTVSGVAAISAAGTTGLSAAGITSGLAALGGTVGGGMVAGTTVVVAAPAVAAAGLGLGASSSASGSVHPVLASPRPPLRGRRSSAVTQSCHLSLRTTRSSPGGALRAAVPSRAQREARRYTRRRSCSHACSCLNECQIGGRSQDAISKRSQDDRSWSYVLRRT